MSPVLEELSRGESSHSPGDLSANATVTAHANVDALFDVEAEAEVGFGNGCMTPRLEATVDDALSPYVDRHSSRRRRAARHYKSHGSSSRGRPVNPILAMAAAMTEDEGEGEDDGDNSLVPSASTSSLSALELAAAAGDAVGRLMADMAIPLEHKSEFGK